MKQGLVYISGPCFYVIIKEGSTRWAVEGETIAAIQKRLLTS